MFLKKTFKSFLVFVLVFLMMASVAPQAQAEFKGICSNGVTAQVDGYFLDVYGTGQGEIKITVNNLTRGQNYYLAMYAQGAVTRGLDAISWTGNQTYSGSPLTFTLKIPTVSQTWDTTQLVLHNDTLLAFSGLNPEVCSNLGTTKITSTINLNCKIQVTQNRNGKTCDVLTDSGRCVSRNYPLIVDVLVQDQNVPPVAVTEDLNIDIRKGKGFCVGPCWQTQSPTNGQATFSVGSSYYPSTDGEYRIGVSLDTTGFNYMECGDVTYNLQPGECVSASGTPICGADGGMQDPDDDSSDGANPYRLCAQIPNDSLRAQCEDCAGGPFGRDGVWTAIGCINRDPKSIIKSLMQIGIGMGGGVALLSTLAGGFILSTSQGDPTKANQAKEIITNSIIGLLFIIFSVVILQFIGFTIFNIPGFGAIE